MQFIKIILVAFVFILNLTIAQPSWAGKDFTKGADYAEVTQALYQLLSVRDNPEQAAIRPNNFKKNYHNCSLRSM
ncbi:hypothetical protein [Nostoc piscinale]|uniref:hypothetical protein n=1 Tax=Nostoc piscinale TaxID=224012 RepID=UPI000AEE1FCA|nr:hypothetical protein [Nostoc piscinale]